MKHRVQCLIAAIVMLGAARLGLAQDEALLLKDTKGSTSTIELVQVETALYVPTRFLADALRKADPQYTVEFDNKTGILRITKGDLKTLLFLAEAKILAGDSLIKCDAPLRVYQGEVLIPYASFEVINKYFAEFELINPPAQTKRLEKIRSEMKPPPQESGTTPVAYEETVRDLSFVEIPKETQIETPQRLHEALAKEERPRVPGGVVLDPGGSDEALPGVEDAAAPARITLQFAQRVKNILEESGSLSVAMTQEDTANLRLEERVSRINTSGAQLLVSFRVDASEFTNLRGIEIFCAHEAVDWQGRQYQGEAQNDDALPPQLLYLRHQYHSLVLAGFVKRELKRAVPVQIGQVKLAPLYILKRANMPSVTIVLGFASNKEDVNLLSDAGYVESVSRAVAGAILSYRRYLELAGKETSTP